MSFAYELGRQLVKTAGKRVGAVLPYGEGYLLELLQNPKWPDTLGKTRLVGGHVDEGEDYTDTLKRELQEELSGVDLADFPSQMSWAGPYQSLRDEPEYRATWSLHNLHPGVYQATKGQDKSVHLVYSPELPASNPYELGRQIARKYAGFFDFDAVAAQPHSPRGVTHSSGPTRAVARNNALYSQPTSPGFAPGASGDASVVTSFGLPGLYYGGKLTNRDGSRPFPFAKAKPAVPRVPSPPATLGQSSFRPAF